MHSRAKNISAVQQKATKLTDVLEGKRKIVTPVTKFDKEKKKADPILLKSTLLGLKEYCSHLNYTQAEQEEFFSVLGTWVVNNLSESGSNVTSSLSNKARLKSGEFSTSVTPQGCTMSIDFGAIYKEIEIAYSISGKSSSPDVMRGLQTLYEPSNQLAKFKTQSVPREYFIPVPTGTLPAGRYLATAPSKCPTIVSLSSSLSNGNTVPCTTDGFHTAKPAVLGDLKMAVPGVTMNGGKATLSVPEGLYTIVGKSEGTFSFADGWSTLGAWGESKLELEILHRHTWEHILSENGKQLARLKGQALAVKVEQLRDRSFEFHTCVLWPAQCPQESPFAGIGIKQLKNQLDATPYKSNFARVVMSASAEMIEKKQRMTNKELQVMINAYQKATENWTEEDWGNLAASWGKPSSERSTTEDIMYKKWSEISSIVGSASTIYALVRTYPITLGTHEIEINDGDPKKMKIELDTKWGDKLKDVIKKETERNAKKEGVGKDLEGIKSHIGKMLNPSLGLESDPSMAHLSSAMGEIVKTNKMVDEMVQWGKTLSGKPTKSQFEAKAQEMGWTASWEEINIFEEEIDTTDMPALEGESTTLGSGNQALDNGSSSSQTTSQTNVQATEILTSTPYAPQFTAGKDALSTLNKIRKGEEHPTTIELMNLLSATFASKPDGKVQIGDKIIAKPSKKALLNSNLNAAYTRLQSVEQWADLSEQDDFWSAQLERALKEVHDLYVESTPV